MATTKMLNVTESAATKLTEILKEQGQDNGMLRVMLTPTPNGGFQHVLGVETEPKEDDIVLEYFNIKVVVDSVSAPLLEGAEIDYLDGLMRSGFVISNPNIENVNAGGGGCACGGGGCGAGGGGCGGGCGTA